MREQDASYVQSLRKRILIAGMRAGKAHLASAYSILETLVALYIRGVLAYDPDDALSLKRDTLILSKGHGSLALYAVLCEVGFIEEEELMSFCQPGSSLGGEPVLGVPGIEATTGSLGHGLSLGVGEALAYKLDGRTNSVYVIVGDGECEEGSIWEAAMSAARYSLDNITVIMDNNKVQKMGPVAEIAGIADWEHIWASLGWDVMHVDGHDIDKIEDALRMPAKKDRPRVIIAETLKGKGVSLMEGSSSWHWRLPKRREMRVFASELGMSEQEVEQCKKRI